MRRGRIMGGMGNPRTPPGLKLLRSDPITGRDSRGKRAPTVANLPRYVPEIPAIVAKDQLALQCWRWATPTLQRAHLLHDASVLPLIGLCTSYAMYARAPEGHAKGRVMSRATLDHGRDFRAWCGRFGLDPAAEGLLAQAAEQVPDEDDPFA
jgi:phage terminase small subunit